jgi:FkbH-like protein
VLDIEQSLSLEKLMRTRWAFGEKDRAYLTTKFRFGEDGLIQGYKNPNESRWTFNDGVIEIFNAKDQIMWRSDHLYVRDGGLCIALKAPRHAHLNFVLHECTADGRVGYGGSPALSAAEFLFPKDLRVTPTEIRTVLLIGSCLTALYHVTFKREHPETKFDYIVFNYAAKFPQNPPSKGEDYDFIYLQLPIRSVVTDRVVTGGRLNDPHFLYEVYADGCNVIDAMLESGLTYNKSFGIPAFVSNFIVPQMDASLSVDGRRGGMDLAELIRRLNAYLSEAVAAHKNVYLCDVDSLASSVGKRYFLDDVFGFYTHGAVFEQDGLDLSPHARIEPVPHISTFYESKKQEFLDAVYEQAVSTYRSVRQLDQVKAVVFDLDNTLWRGQLVEDYRPGKGNRPPPAPWQNGLREAVHHLRARGILVAISSKNDFDVVKERWGDVVTDPNFLKLEDFASVKINWRPKADNISEICAEFNIKPKSVVFVDDNPVEREAVKSALPGIRVIGSNPYLTRRILLWSAETKPAVLTEESVKREESIRGQIVREEKRASLSREEFLKSLNCRMEFTIITSADQPEFTRVLELTNKTNQFNTTGKRWTSAEATTFFSNGGQVLAFRVQDKFADYGLVGAIYATTSTILQFVMSCRVMGMEIEQAGLVTMLNRVREGSTYDIDAVLIETADNSPCREVFSDAGFTVQERNDNQTIFVLPGSEILSPPIHIEISAS